MKRIVILVIISILCVRLQGQDTTALEKNTGKKGSQTDYRAQMREGNKLYEADKPVDAETAYRRALEIDDKADKAIFNLGNALYRQEKYEEAGKQFDQIAQSMTDKTDRARAYHNLGNSMLKQQKYKESIEAYKSALRNNPDDADTKYNLSYALNMLKQQEQQQQDKDDRQDKDNKDQQDKDKQNQDQKDNRDKQNQNQEQKSGQDKKEEQQQQKQQQQQMSREDAQRMLDALAQEEKDLQEKLQKKERAGSRPAIEKNW